MTAVMRMKLIVFIALVSIGIVGALGWVGYQGYQLFMTGFSAKIETHALEVLMVRKIRHLASP